MNYINPEFYCLAIPNPDGNITRTYFVEEEEKLDRLKFEITERYEMAKQLTEEEKNGTSSIDNGIIEIVSPKTNVRIFFNPKWRNNGKDSLEFRALSRESAIEAANKLHFTLDFK